MPQALQDNGGWLNDEIVETYAAYARLCFELFGDRVKRWTTVNEPFISGMMGYYYANFAPCIEEPLEGPYTYVHHQLMAHTQAYRIYEKDFKQKQGGVVGITLDTSYYIPADKSNKDDVEATNRAFIFRVTDSLLNSQCLPLYNRVCSVNMVILQLGWMLDPLFHGRYPKVMRELIDARSKSEGRVKSRLPEFTPAWSEKLKGALDFIGINYYNAELCKGRSDGTLAPEWKVAFGIPFFTPDLPGWNQDMNVFRSHDPEWTRCGAPWQDFAPGGIRGCIKWVADTYGNPTMMVTETGCSGEDYRHDDIQRKHYFKYSLNAVLKAVKQDGYNVVGYVGWSLLDVYEWMSGYT